MATNKKLGTLSTTQQGIVDTQKQQLAAAKKSPSNVISAAKTAVKPLAAPATNTVGLKVTGKTTTPATPVKTVPTPKNTGTETKPVPGQTPEIYKPGYVSGYTKPEAQKIEQKTLERQKTDKTTPLAQSMQEAEAIRVARGQTGAKGTLPEAGLPVADNAGEGVIDKADSEANRVEQERQKFLDENEVLKKAQIAGEEGLRDFTIEQAQKTYEIENANLDEYQRIQDQTLEARNKFQVEGADIQRDDAEAAYAFSQAQLEQQRARTAKAYQDTILDQKQENTKRTLAEENRIAASGGYGSFVKNQQLQDLTLRNDRELNNIVFESQQSEIGITNKMVELNKTYTNSLRQIDLEKQQGIQSNYDSYLTYVADIQKNRELSQSQKDAAIKEAAVNYKKNVAQINQSSFDTRYKISTEMSEKARMIRKDEKDDARQGIKNILSDFIVSPDDMTPAQLKQITKLEQISGYPVGATVETLRELKKQAVAQNLDISSQVNDNGDVTYVTVDKATGKVVNTATVKGIAALNSTKSNYSLEYDPVTGERFVFDPATGQIIGAADASAGGSGLYTPGEPTMLAPKGTVLVGDKAIPQNVINNVFKVGQPVGWCGVFASTLSTAPMVGNTWAEKSSHIDKRDNPKPGDKLLLPLGVKTDKDYGHVATVLSFDPGTGNITVAESNKDGRQNRGEGQGVATIGSYNINDLNSKYDNWGFASGSLKPGIQAVLSQNAQPAIRPSAGGSTEVNQQLDTMLGSVAEYEAMANTVDGRKTLQALRTKFGAEAVNNWVKSKEGAATTIPAEIRTKLQADPSVKKVKAANDFNLALKAYRDMVSSASDLETWGENKSKMDAAYNNLKIQFKNAAELGAITAPDVPLIEGAIKPMSKDWFDVAGRSQFALGGGKQGVLSSLDTALTLSNQRKENAMQELDTLYPEYSNSDYFNQIRGATVDKPFSFDSFKPFAGAVGNIAANNVGSFLSKIPAAPSTKTTPIPQESMVNSTEEDYFNNL